MVCVRFNHLLISDEVSPDMRQLPLFQTQPAWENDLNTQTRMMDALPLFQTFLKQQAKTDHTISAFTSDLLLLEEYHGEESMLGWFTTTRLNDFLSWMENRRGIPCSRKTYARRVTTLKVFFKWLKESDVIPLDPALAVLQRSGPAPLAEILSTAQIQAVLAVARLLRRGEKPDARPEMLFRLILSTGIKKSEAMRLTVEDIQRDAPDGAQLLVKHEGAKDRYRERYLPLDMEFFPALDEYLLRYHPQATLFTCTARNLEYILEDLGNGAGIAQKISFEMLRWTFAVRSYQSGLDPNTIREALGLSEISWVETFHKIKQLAANQAESQFASV